LWRRFAQLGRSTLQVLPKETSRLPLLIGMFCTALWIWVCAPEITFFDTGELAGAGFALGLSHPPGQPFHALVCKAFTFIPLGTIGFRCNLLSAVCAGLSLMFLGRLAKSLWPQRAVETGLVAAACLALCWALTEQAVRTEVYTLTLLLILAAYWALAPLFSADRSLWSRSSRRVLRFRRISLDASVVPTSGRSLPSGIDLSAKLPFKRPLVVAGLCLALAAATHPLMAASSGLVLFLAALGWALKRHRLGTLIVGGVAVLLGSSVWLYLPLSARRNPLIKLGNPETLTGFWEMISARAYQANVGESTHSLGALLWAHIKLVSFLSGVFVVVAATVAIIAAVVPKTKQRLSLVLPVGLFCASLIPPLTMARFLPFNPDLHGYLLPCLAGGALLATWTVVVLPSLLFRSKRLRTTTRSVLALAVLLPTGLANGNWLLSHTYHGPEAHELTAQVGTVIHPGPAVVSAQNDHFLFPLLYAQAVEGWRPDVALVGSWLVGSTAHWYRRQIKTRHPWLFVPVLDDNGNTRHIRRRFVLQNAAKRPFYVETPSHKHRPATLEDCGALYAVRWPALQDPTQARSDTRSPPRRFCAAQKQYPRIFDPFAGRLIDCFVSLYRARFLAEHGRWKASLRQLAPHLGAPPPARWDTADPFLCTHSQPLVLAAKIHMHEKRWIQAAIHLRWALKKEPNRPETHLQLGRLSALRGNFENAEKHFQRARRLAPRNVTALFYNALILARKGHPEQAQALLEKAKKIDPRRTKMLIDAHRKRAARPPQRTPPQRRGRRGR
jgi:hypothetical protein